MVLICVISMYAHLVYKSVESGEVEFQFLQAVQGKENPDIQVGLAKLMIGGFAILI